LGHLTPIKIYYLPSAVLIVAAEHNGIYSYILNIKKEKFSRK
jgi:hypothetical protein